MFAHYNTTFVYSVKLCRVLKRLALVARDLYRLAPASNDSTADTLRFTIDFQLVTQPPAPAYILFKRVTFECQSIHSRDWNEVIQ